MAQHYNFMAMSLDALWRLHEEMRVVLATKLAEQQLETDSRLIDLADCPPHHAGSPTIPPRRIYRNPDAPYQTWSGRGLRPRWMIMQVAAGRMPDEFLVHADVVEKKPAPVRRKQLA